MSTPAEQIKDRLSIVDVVSAYLKIEKAGINYKARCPFHNEKTASFFVSPTRGSFHCFGCNKGGDIFSFIEEIEGINFSEALKILAERAGVNLHEYGKVFDPKIILYKIMEDTTEFFEQNLVKHKDAVKYLQDRGLANETIKDFRIGFADDAWQNVLNYLRAKKYKDEDIERVGLIIKSEKNTTEKYYDRFRGRIMFPISDAQGRPVAFSGRVFGGDEKNAKYVNSPETALYDKSGILYGYDKAKREIMKQGFCVVVEGQMDLIMSHQAGVRNSVAVSGTALTDKHIDLLKRFTETIVLSFDADEAGFAASQRAVKTALLAGMDVKAITIPEGKDPADLVKKDPKVWVDLVNDGKHIVDFYLGVLSSKITDPRILIKEISKKVLPVVADIKNKIDQAHFIKKIAGIVGVGEESIREEIGRMYSKTVPQGDILPQKLPQEDRIRHRIAGFMFLLKEKKEEGDSINLFKDRIKEICDKDFENFVKELSNLSREEAIFEAEVLSSGNKNKLIATLSELLDSLEKNILDNKLKFLLIELKRFEEKKDEVGARKTLTECQNVTNRINQLKNKK